MQNKRNALISLSAAALVAIAWSEGYREHAYDDGIGVQTIGFGTTSGVKAGDKTDPVRALGLLYRDANEMVTQLSRPSCIGDVPVYQHEADAFISLTYNIGASAFCKSTLAKKLKQNPPDYAGACTEILRWNKAGGRALAGLKKRRQQEYELCTYGDNK
ncbi:MULTISPECIES: lysozyme [Nitrosomonas]|uniref:Lysozyme n=1 Tax=Nitrosomonas communis TaxID=44574 RepID=A0A0F7KDR0_9PROT|nr:MULTISPECIES: lysozyme [Nitrosomonas]AKH36884.1 histidine kinase [Nitrosomonas communis]TYP83896.1 lysozyme [Nitrosomonas communis]UVS61990.1 lysozyme [Nitrosomonas sp. PLL12]